MHKTQKKQCSQCESKIEVAAKDGRQNMVPCSGCGTWFDVYVVEGRVVEVLEEYPPGSSARWC